MEQKPNLKIISVDSNKTDSIGNIILLKHADYVVRLFDRMKEENGKYFVVQVVKIIKMLTRQLGIS